MLVKSLNLISFIVMEVKLFKYFLTSMLSKDGPTSFCIMAKANPRRVKPLLNYNNSHAKLGAPAVLGKRRISVDKK